MKAVLLLLLLAYVQCGWAQVEVQGKGLGHGNMPQSAMGSITVPSLMSIQVQANNNNIRFDNPLDFINGKSFPNFLNITVVGTQPWLVSYRTISPYFTPLTPGASADMPVSVMRLKKSGSSEWQSLSHNAQVLMYSNNSNISNTYSFDAVMELGWKYRSGNYTTTVLFTLTPQ